MEYLGIAREGIKNFYDTCGCWEERQVMVRGKLKNKRMQRRVQLFIHSPWLAPRPEILGEKTRDAIRNGILKVYSANEAVQHLTSTTVRANTDALHKILSKEDYETFFGGVEKKNTKSRKRKTTRKKAPRLQPSPAKVQHEPTTESSQQKETAEHKDEESKSPVLEEKTSQEERTE